MNTAVNGGRLTADVLKDIDLPARRPWLRAAIVGAVPQHPESRKNALSGGNPDARLKAAVKLFELAPRIQTRRSVVVDMAVRAGNGLPDGRDCQIAVLQPDISRVVGIALDFSGTPTVPTPLDIPLGRVRGRAVRSIELVVPDLSPRLYQSSDSILGAALAGGQNGQLEGSRLYRGGGGHSQCRFARAINDSGSKLAVASAGKPCACKRTRPAKPRSAAMLIVPSGVLTRFDPGVWPAEIAALPTDKRIRTERASLGRLRKQFQDRVIVVDRCPSGSSSAIRFPWRIQFHSMAFHFASLASANDV